MGDLWKAYHDGDISCNPFYVGLGKMNFVICNIDYINQTILRGMLLQMQVFGRVDPTSTEPADWKLPLENVFAGLTSWRKQHKISSSQKRFKFRMLFREEHGFFLSCKGFNARLVCEWILSVVGDIQRNPPADLIPDDRLDLSATALILDLIQSIVVLFCHGTRHSVLSKQIAPKHSDINMGSQQLFLSQM